MKLAYIIQLLIIYTFNLFRLLPSCAYIFNRLLKRLIPDDYFWFRVVRKLPSNKSTQCDVMTSNSVWKWIIRWNKYHHVPSYYAHVRSYYAHVPSYYAHVRSYYTHVRSYYAHVRSYYARVRSYYALSAVNGQSAGSDR